MSKTSFYLDPDYRKTPDTSKPYCVRCQKPLKKGSKVVKVHFVDEWHVSEGGTELIGLNCWKQITKK